MSWTVIGEAGKALDETPRTFENLALRMQSSQIQKYAYGNDRFTGLQDITDLTLATETVPELGQTVEFWQEIGGDNQREFAGIMTRPKVIYRGGSAHQVRWNVAGLDWWLRQVMLTGASADQVARVEDRADFVIQQGTVGAAVTAILNRAIELGAPISIGAIEGGMEITRLLLKNQSLWDALSVPLRFQSDAVPFWTYAAGAEPAFNLTLRGGITPTVYSLPSDITSAEIEPALELKVTGVDLKHVARDSARRQVYLEQLSGDAGTAQGGSAASTTWSGTATLIGAAGTATNERTTGNTTQGQVYVDAAVLAAGQAAGAGDAFVDFSGGAEDDLVGQVLTITEGPGAGTKNTIKSHGTSNRYFVENDWAELPTTSSRLELGNNLHRFPAPASQVVGKWIVLTSGPGKGQRRLCVSKDDTTNMAVVAEPWEEGKWPDGTTFFTIEPFNTLVGGAGGSDLYQDYLVQLVSGRGAGQVREWVGGDGGTQIVAPLWDTTPDATTGYLIAHKRLIQLAASDPGMIGEGIHITSGKGAGQVRKIEAINGLVAIVSPDWTDPPDSTSQYEIGARLVTLRAAASDSPDCYNGLNIVTEGQTRLIRQYDAETKEAIVQDAFTTPPTAASAYVVGEGLGDTSSTQVLPISGEELSPFLPQEEFQHADVQSVRIDAGPGDAVDPQVAIRNDQTLVAINNQAPGITLTAVTSPGDVTGAEGTITLQVPTAKLPDGGERPASWDYELIRGDFANWWEDLGFSVFTLRVRGHYKAASVSDPDLGGLPEWLVRIDDAERTFFVGLNSATSEYEWYFYADFEVQAINAFWPSLTRLYRRADYEFTNPPEGMAGALAVAQNFIPYKGPLALQFDGDQRTDHITRAINVTGGPPEWQTMAALVQAVNYPIGTGQANLTLGSPARYSLRDLAGRMRQSPSDNIEVLSSGLMGG